MAAAILLTGCASQSIEPPVPNTNAPIWLPSAGAAVQFNDVVVTTSTPANSIAPAWPSNPVPLPMPTTRVFSIPGTAEALASVTTMGLEICVTNLFGNAPHNVVCFTPNTNAPAPTLNISYVTFPIPRTNAPIFIQASDDLQNWQTVDQGMASTNGANWFYLDVSTNSRRFFRMGMTLP